MIGLPDGEKNFEDMCNRLDTTDTSTSRLDYANSVLYGISAKYISRLQRTQNTLARIAAVLIWLL